jgi:hypothetical protein
VGVGINVNETFGSATRRIFSKTDLGKTCCVDGKWIEMAEDRKQMWALVLAVMKLLVLLPEDYLVKWILEKHAVGMGSGLRWLRNVRVYGCGLW